MKEVTLFTIEAPYREGLDVKAWMFGNPEQKSLAIMGAFRGNEVQQLYIAARLVQTLKQLETFHMLSEDCGIMVVPNANQFSMNVGSRFWAADHTDINRMFPGYNLGETTQRIADHVFTALQGYTYGVQFASFYLPGDFLPHVRMMETGYQHVDEAAEFGLPYVFLRKPQPYDTTTLNYNWQIWNTQAFSLYSTQTESIDPKSAEMMVEAVLRFLYRKGLSKKAVPPSRFQSKLAKTGTQLTVQSHEGGLFFRQCNPGDLVEKGDLLAEILNPYTCEVLEQLRAPAKAEIFFARKAELIGGHEVAFRLMPRD